MTVDSEKESAAEGLMFAGDFTVAAPRAQVWAALTNPEWMSDCVPGLLQYSQVGADNFAGTASIELVGGEMRSFPVAVRWYEMAAPATGRLQGQTRIDKTPIEWQASMTLTVATDGQTAINWEATVTLPEASSQLRRLLRPLLQQMVRKAVTSFLRCVKGKFCELAG